MPSAASYLAGAIGLIRWLLIVVGLLAAIIGLRRTRDRVACRNVHP